MMLAGPPLPTVLPIDEFLTFAHIASGERVALATAEETWAYADLKRGSVALARSYLALGLKPGDRIASLMPNDPWLVAHYLACLASGLVAVPMGFKFASRRDIAEMTDIVGAATIVYDASRESDITRACRGDLRVPPIRSGGSAPDGMQLQKLGIPSGDDGGESGLPCTGGRLPGTAPAMIVFTSGSSGARKGVVWTRSTVAARMASLARGVLPTGEMVIPALSLSAGGGIDLTLSALLLGSAIALCPPTVDSILSALRRHRPLHMVSGPSTLLKLLHDNETAPDDFRSIRSIAGGGDAVPAALDREVHALLGRGINQGYGMTEIGICTASHLHSEPVSGSIGTLMPGFEMELRDADGAPVTVGSAGVAHVRSSTVTPGYWNDSVATERVLKDGWLDTGDLMRADAAGLLWFVNRQKHVIIHDGANVLPSEVEDVLREDAAVSDAVAVGIHDPIHGQAICAFVTVNAGTDRSHEEIAAVAKEKLGEKAPEELFVLQSMPLTAAGKVDRAALTEYGNALFHKPHPEH
ncbi:MAG: class I adenylate-forming enzyme family protein [Pseudomonadota bacterium]